MLSPYYVPSAIQEAGVKVRRKARQVNWSKRSVPLANPGEKSQTRKSPQKTGKEQAEFDIEFPEAASLRLISKGNSASYKRTGKALADCQQRTFKVDLSCANS